MSRIAITSEGPSPEDRVDPRFGRAAGFVVVDLDTLDTGCIDNGQSQVMAQGAGIQAAERIARAGEHRLLTGYMMPKAFQALSAAGIQVGQNLEGLTVCEAVERFQRGQVEIARAANRGAGDDCCGGERQGRHPRNHRSRPRRLAGGPHALCQVGGEQPVGEAIADYYRSDWISSTGAPCPTIRRGKDMLRIVLISTRPEEPRSFAGYLSSEPEVPFEQVDSGATALQAVRASSPHQAIIDSKLPDAAPSSLVRELIQVNAMVNTAVISPLSEGEFHEASEGLGVLARLPENPRSLDARGLLGKLRHVSGE